MRVSVEASDPGHVRNPAEWHVTLDGERVTGAITADEDAGYVDLYVMEDGRLLPDPADPERARTERRHGVVKVTRVALPERQP